MTAGPLGRRPPTDWRHVEKYPLRALATPEQPTRVPVLMGVNWYANFDHPAQDSRGRWWIGLGDFGRLRGGHATVLKPKGLVDPISWWLWHNQISEGICVSEAVARCMALLNRRRYQPRPLYDWAQNNDEFSSTPPEEGTSVRAGLDCARTVGLIPAKRGERHFVTKAEAEALVSRNPLSEHGIAANRWATTVEEVFAALGYEGASAVPMLNSWGQGYPHIVYLPDEAIDRLLREDGEFGIVVDR